MKWTVRAEFPFLKFGTYNAFGTLYHFTKVTSDDVTMMTSWWNTSRMFIISKISDILRHHDVISQ